MFQNIVRFYGKELLTSRVAHKLEDHHFFGCPLLFIQYIDSYTLHLEDVLPHKTKVA